MKDRNYNSFRDIKDASFGGRVKSRRADGGRIHVVVTENPDALNEATGPGQLVSDLNQASVLECSIRSGKLTARISLLADLWLCLRAGMVNPASNARLSWKR